jgi:hypothetical protein
MVKFNGDAPSPANDTSFNPDILAWFEKFPDIISKLETCRAAEAQKAYDEVVVFSASPASKKQTSKDTFSALGDVIRFFRRLTLEILEYEQVKHDAKKLAHLPVYSYLCAAIDAFPVDQLTSSVMIGTKIHMLPSAEGRGYWASINGFYGDHAQDGWFAPTYSHVRGVAEEPENPTVWTLRVRNRLAAQGVRFLPSNEVPAYMEKEGNAWIKYHERSRFGSDHDTSVDSMVTKYMKRFFG